MSTTLHLYPAFQQTQGLWQAAYPTDNIDPNETGLAYFKRSSLESMINRLLNILQEKNIIYTLL